MRTGPFQRALLKVFLASAACFLLLAASPRASAQSASGHPDWPGKGQLFVGTCYDPVGRSPEQIHRDIAIMKGAGFNLVRMGDLSWYSFEPSEGTFEFAWFDKIMDEMAANGIKVILDIPGLPAPMWLHHKYPGANVVTQNGVMLHAAERYMEDISDPDYRRLATGLADALTKHYAHHPALMAVGYDNEIGNGFMSYSAADRTRFIDWLKAKYGSVEALNKAWATQFWSRELNDWDEIELPYGDGPGPVEPYLDLRRFWSDQTVDALKELDAVRQRNLPDTPAVSNLWPTAGRKGFDYLSSYRDYVSYGAEGFYPGDAVSASLGALMNRGALDTPIWFNEFTAGGGGYYGTKGRSRMWANLGLIDYAQTILAWTFLSQQGGEEQALFGLVDHDNTPSWKVAEFAQIAAEFRKLAALGFPREAKPQVAIAYSFDSAVATNPPGQSNTVRQYFLTPYDTQVQNAFEPFFTDNIDAAIINVGHDSLDRYKLVVVAGDYIMDEKSADAIRRYVESGGTVIMTGYSAKADEHAQWFDTPLPGRLSDVFGLHTNAFYRSDKPLEVMVHGKVRKATDPYYEILELDNAKPYARFLNTPEKSAAVAINRYGKGQAIYLATAAQPSLLGPLLRSLYARLAIERGPQTPPGVYARVVDGRTLYVNTTTEPKSVRIRGTHLGILSGRRYSGSLGLEGYGVELLQ
ncbi:MAG: beta-galactosidase [Alphaproteobacteria bacterium]|nr:beta-galactosidase [Alphaproteobacteria bacterium]